MRLVVEGWFLGLPAAAWLEVLFDLVVKGALMLASVHLLTRFLGWRRVSLRSRIWTLAFVLLLALPTVSVLLGTIVPGVDLPVHGFREAMLTVSQAEDAAPEIRLPARAPAQREPAGVTSPTAVEETAFTSSSFPLRHWKVPVTLWLLGVVWFGARTFLGLAAGLRAARAAVPDRSDSVAALIHRGRKTLGIRGPVGHRFSEKIQAPFVTGVIRPILVLPASVRRWDEERLRAVILHELAHVRRRDLPRLVTMDLACALHWFNPLVWAGARRARLDAEIACDAVACNGAREALDYARQLVWFAGRVTRTGEPARLPGVAGRSGLERRIRTLLAGETRPSGLRGGLLAVGVPALVLGLALPLAAFRIVGHDSAVPTTPVVDETAATARPRESLETAPAPGIHAAAAAGDVARVKDLLAADPSLLDARDDRGMTALALAAWNDHIGLVRHLIDLGADVDVKNHNGLTPLFCAIDRTRLATARLLMRSGADLDTRGYRGRTLLHMAARAGDAGLVRDLLDHGAEVNRLDARGAAPLDIAAWHGNRDVVELLARHGGVPAGTGRSTPRRRLHTG